MSRCWKGSGYMHAQIGVPQDRKRRRAAKSNPFAAKLGEDGEESQTHQWVQRERETDHRKWVYASMLVTGA